MNHGVKVGLTLLLPVVACVLAADAPRDASGSNPPPWVPLWHDACEEAAGEKGKWTVISGKLPLTAQETAGVAVDRTMGDLFVILTNDGLWRSSDKGNSFVRVDGTNVSGRCETGCGLHVDPNQGGRIACFMLDGKGGFTVDGGKTWNRVLPLTGLEAKLDPKKFGGNRCSVAWFDHFA